MTADAPRRPGRPPGTTKDDTKRSGMYLRCRAESRERWREAAEREGLGLSAWVRKTLDAATD